MHKHLRRLVVTAALALGLMAPPLSWAAAETLKGPAPDFTLKSRDGSNVKLSELKGQVVLINFWATWCGPCRQEMPLLDQLHRKYQKLGFTVLGINVEEDTSKAQLLLKDIPVSFPILYDPTSTVSKLYNVNAMPFTVLVDRDGNWRQVHRGYLPGYETEYATAIRALLKE